MILTADAQRIVGTLGRLENAVEPRHFPTDREVADKPGMYAWWADTEARNDPQRGDRRPATALALCRTGRCDEMAFRQAVLGDAEKPGRRSTHPRQRSLVDVPPDHLVVAGPEAWSRCLTPRQA